MAQKRRKNVLERAKGYRGVLEAMGAMGVDFVFATEHASNSKQIVDGDTSVGIPPVSEDSCVKSFNASNNSSGKLAFTATH